MPVFRYVAYNAGGKESTGAVEAQSLRDAATVLKRDGLFIKSLEALEPYPTGSGRARFSDVAVFTDQLSSLLGSGASLREALTLLLDETDDPGLKKVITELREDITTGASFAAAVRKHPKIFKPVYASAIEAGEATGSLAPSLSRLSEYLESGRRIRETLRSAVLYPAVMSAAGAGVLFFLFVFVLPRMAGVFEETGQPLPFLTKAFIYSGWLIGSYWYVFAILLAALVFAARKAASKPRGRALLDRWLLGLPYAGRVSRKYFAAQFAWTLGTLLSGGVPILKALDMTRRAMSGNSIFENALANAIGPVSEGVPLSSALKEAGAFPAILIHFIRIGENTGNLDKLLMGAARRYEEEFQGSVKKALSVLEPAIVLVMGAAVGLIVLAVLVPVLDISMAAR